LEVVNGLTFSFTQDEVTVLRRQVAEALKFGYVVRGRQLPRLLAEVGRELACASQCRENPQASLANGTAGFRDAPSLSVSEQPVRLTVKEAACLAKVSEGYMRRLIRRGDVEAIRGYRGAWQVDISSAGAWIASQRRKERDRKAA
jgi:hypothetical protein